MFSLAGVPLSKLFLSEIVARPRIPCRRRGVRVHNKYDLALGSAQPVAHVWIVVSLSKSCSLVPWESGRRGVLWGAAVGWGECEAALCCVVRL